MAAAAVADPVDCSATFKACILERLRKRNQAHNNEFSAFYTSHARLFEANAVLYGRVEQLMQEKIELQLKLDSTGGSSSSGNDAAQLQTKLKQQEELTHLLRERGEKNQEIINLKNQLAEKDKELTSKEAAVLERENELAQLKQKKLTLENKVLELEATNQMLKDEQQALQMAFVSLEEKFRKCQDDNNDLVTRWMTLKSRDADLMNEENEHVLRMKQLKLRQDLEAATREYVSVTQPYNSPIPICISATVPSKMQHDFDAHEGEVNAIRWSPTGKLFASGGADRKIKLWHLINYRSDCRGTFTGSNAAIMSVDFDYEETLVLGSSYDFASRVWSVADQRLRHTLTGHSGKVLAAKFLGGNSKVVSGSHDRTLKIWDLRGGACIKTIFAGSSCNDVVVCDGSGSMIISGHFDKKIRFWDTRSDVSANEITLQGRVTSLDVSSDGLHLLSCARDDTLKLIDIRMNQVMATFSANAFRVGCDYTRAALSPDGQFVAAGSSDGTVFAWNVAKNRVEKQLKEHVHSVIACSWHPAGNMLLTCDRQKRAILWTEF